MLISKEFALKLHEGITARGLCGFSFVSSSGTQGKGFGTAACVAQLRAPQQGGQRHKEASGGFTSSLLGLGDLLVLASSSRPVR